MAKITLNSALHNIRGRIDNWVYRKFGDGVIIARRPEPAGPPTVAQLAVREQFRAAAAYAKAVFADPLLRSPYEVAARAKGTPLFAFVMGDFLNPPVVSAIDVTGYHGHVGDPVKVAASDDFEVVSVHVAIRDAALAVIEQGPAALVGGLWAYAATVAVAPGDTVTIEAVAKDHPGQAGSKTVPCLVG